MRNPFRKPIAKLQTINMSAFWERAQIQLKKNWATKSANNKNFIEKFLGFFQLLENNSFLGVWGKVFGWLPPGISSVITTALGIGACVGLFKFFRK